MKSALFASDPTGCLVGLRARSHAELARRRLGRPVGGTAYRSGSVPRPTRGSADCTARRTAVGRRRDEALSPLSSRSWVPCGSAT